MKYECPVCHRKLFTYEAPTKEKKETFSFKCPMCVTDGSIEVSSVSYEAEDFMTDPTIKDKMPKLKPQKEEMKPEELSEEKSITITIHYNVEPDILPPEAHFVLKELIEQAKMQFIYIIQSGEVARVAQEMIKIRKAMESGILPVSGMPPGHQRGCPPGGMGGQCGFPNNL